MQVQRTSKSRSHFKSAHPGVWLSARLPEGVPPTATLRSRFPMLHTVFSFIPTEEQAGVLLNNLHDNGFGKDQISILCGAKMHQSALFGDTVLGSALEWLCLAETVEFKSQGMFLATGPILNR